jgi:hypothetical protein
MCVGLAVRRQEDSLDRRSAQYGKLHTERWVPVDDDTRRTFHAIQSLRPWQAPDPAAPPGLFDAYVPVATECRRATPFDGREHLPMQPCQPRPMFDDEVFACRSNVVRHFEGRPIHCFSMTLTFLGGISGKRS